VIKQEANNKEVDVLINALDRIVAGTMKWETRLRTAIAGQESGLHMLRVRLDRGVVKEVVHSAEEKI